MAFPYWYNLIFTPFSHTDVAPAAACPQTSLLAPSSCASAGPHFTPSYAVIVVSWLIPAKEMWAGRMLTNYRSGPKISPMLAPLFSIFSPLTGMETTPGMILVAKCWRGKSRDNTAPSWQCWVAYLLWYTSDWYLRHKWILVRFDAFLGFFVRQLAYP